MLSSFPFMYAIHMYSNASVHHVLAGPFSSRTSITSAAAAAAAAASLYVTSPTAAGVPNLAGTLFDNQVRLSHCTDGEGPTTAT
jgi:hypothetical protein